MSETSSPSTETTETATAPEAAPSTVNEPAGEAGAPDPAAEGEAPAQVPFWKKIKFPKKKAASASGRPDEPGRLRRFGRDLAHALLSPDRHTRRMGILFLVGCVGALWVSTVAIERYLHYRSARQAELSSAELERKKLGEFFEKQAAEARDRASWVELGRYTVDAAPAEGAKPAEAQPGRRRDIHGLADVELSAKCSDKSTREFIEGHMIRVRNEISSALASLERDDLLTLEGKRRTKKRVADRLNSWLTDEGVDGHVQDVFISGLIVS